MKFSNYQKLALRTCKHMINDLDNILHMVLGLVDEYFELGEEVVKESNTIAKSNKDNVIKEIGDVLWYLSGLCYFGAYDFSRGESGFKKYRLGECLRIITGAYKANWIYDRCMDVPDKTGLTPRKNVQDAIYSIIMALDELCHEMNISLTDDCMVRNIEKLQMRYPNEYTDYAANNKNESVE